MPEPKAAPYGAWKSPISASTVASATIELDGVMLDGDDVYWLEGRPQEGGRVVIMKLPRPASGPGNPDDEPREPVQVTPAYDPAGRANFNVRTRANEYGGGAYTVWQGVVFFSNFADQRIYRQDPGRDPHALTPAGVDLRYADYVFDAARGRLVGVREDHRVGDREAENSIVAVDVQWKPGEVGGEGESGKSLSENRSPSRLVSLSNQSKGGFRIDSKLDEGRVLVRGHDFFSNPSISPDGGWLAWLCWDHPNMPWDGCELWVARLASDGEIVEPQHVAGGPAESIWQPQWSPDGLLYFVSDRSGWWNLYRCRPGEALRQAAEAGAAELGFEPVYPRDAEFGKPAWVFGGSTYAFPGSGSAVGSAPGAGTGLMAGPGAGRIVCSYEAGGMGRLALLEEEDAGPSDSARRSDAAGTGWRLSPLAPQYTTFVAVRGRPDRAYCLAGSPVIPLSLIEIDLAERATAPLTVLRRSSTVEVDPRYTSAPEAIEFPTEAGLTAFAYYYPPVNQDYQGPEGEKPPLIVFSHGGPTGATSASYNPRIQYWTSRGFAVLDVNYGGSTGYGRAYRERLNGRWGIVDVDDCVNGAKYLAERGLVDGKRMAIRGRSAGGYTTLAALTFRDVFAAGASYFGVSDVEALATDTHKFESRYMDRMVGSYPERRDLYVERSPIHHTNRLARPVIFFQGLDDKIVPPDQAERMFEAVKSKGLPTAYLPLEGEGHGFRKAENLVRTLEAEYYFYSRIFGFTPAEQLPGVEKVNG